MILTRYETVYADAGSDSSVCADSVYQLSGNLPDYGTGLWTTQPGINFNNQSIYNTTAINLPSGEPVINIDFIWTITNGVCINANTILLIRYEIIPADAGDATSLCDISSIDLAGNNPLPGNGIWACNNSEIVIEDATVFNTNISNIPVNAGEDTEICDNNTNEINFSWTIKNGVCPSDTSYMLLKRYETILADAEDDAGICDSIGYFLSANDPCPAKGMWTCTEEGISFENGSYFETLINGLPRGETIFTWTVTNGACGSNSDEIIITRYISDIANAGADTSFCDINEYQIIADSILGTGTGSWTSNSDSVIFDNYYIHNPNISNIPTGKNIFIWKIENNVCPESLDSLIVDIYQTIVADAGKDSLFCNYTEYQLLADSVLGTGIGMWTSISSVNIEKETLYNTNISNISFGESTYIWTIENGACGVSADSILLTNYEFVQADAGADDKICDITEYQLSGNIATPGTGLWTISPLLTIDNATIGNATIYDFSIGNYEEDFILTWTITNGVCIDENTMILTRYETVFADAGENDSICDISQYQLSGEEQDYGTGMWTSIDEDINFDNPSIYNATATNLTNENEINEIIFKWTLTNGVCIDENTMILMRYETINANAGINNYICDTSEYKMLANNPQPGTGIWTCNKNDIYFSDTSAFDTDISNIQEGDIIFTWEITNGVCISNDNFELKASHTPFLDMENDIEFCKSTDTLLQAPFGYDTYLWQDGSTEETFYANKEGYYSLTITNICGMASKDFYLIERPLPEAFAGENIVVCQGDTITLTATGGIKQTWNNDIEQTTPFVAETTETYIVTAESEHRCLNKDTIIVYVNPKPIITELITDEEGYKITVLTQSDANPLRYAINNGYFQKENYFECLESGNYSVAVKDTNNCITIDFAEIKSISIPTVFTPNGDAYNETWKIENLKESFPDAEVFIYDRWGNEIYKGTDWDGTSNGRVVKSDTYWYIISIAGCKTFKGSITIKR